MREGVGETRDLESVLRNAGSAVEEEVMAVVVVVESLAVEEREEGRE